MTSRHRRDQSRFDVQGDALSLNGIARPALTINDAQEMPVPGQSADASAAQAESHLDKIEISPRAIAHLASRATQRSYGVVGLAQSHSRPGWVELLRREEAYKGVDVTFPDSRVLIELYVVIEYGTRISEVARNIMSNVKFAVESALGVSVVQVNVNVQDIHVSETGV